MYSQLEIDQVNIHLQEDQLEDAIVYEEEEQDKCKSLIDNIAGLKNSVNTLNTKIITQLKLNTWKIKRDIEISRITNA